MPRKLLNIVKIPRIRDDGYLFFAQNPEQVPFVIKRVYFITKPVKGLPRGKHAHKKNKQLLFCIRGKVKMLMDDGKKRRSIVLGNPEKGIYIDSMVWHEMLDMNVDTILLVLASEKFDPKDYIRNYDEFLKLARKKQ